MSVLPQRVRHLLLKHLARCKTHHTTEAAEGRGCIWVPHVLERKYPGVGQTWQWVFPAKGYYFDCQLGRHFQHHYHETLVQRAMRQAVLQAHRRARGLYGPYQYKFRAFSVACGLSNRPVRYAVGAISSVSSKDVKVEYREPKRRGLIGAGPYSVGSKDLMRCPATRVVEALSFQRWFDSTVGRHPMIQAGGSERACVAHVAGVLVGSFGRGVAVRTSDRRWPGTTRCNGLAVIVMRGGDPVSRGPLIAIVRRRKVIVAEVVYYVAASVDGYIATPDGAVDWLAPFHKAGADHGYIAFLAMLGGIVMGRRTYDQVRGFGPWPYAGLDCRVVTSRALPDAPDRVAPVANPAEAVAGWAGRRVWLVGGTALLDGFRAARLVREYHVFVMPALLGAGVPLFRTGPAARLQLEHVGCLPSGVAEFRYRVVDAEPTDAMDSQ